MANNFFPVITLTGGGVGALDNIDGNALVEGDAAFAVTGTLTRIYRLNATSGVTEDSPDIIAPDTNAGTKRWILVGVVTTSEEILKISKSDYATLLATSTSIVDVLLETTRDDSDGGEWRLMCQDKAWYNETLNTATRGATRAFPEDYAIIAETDTVTMFDMTIPSCPMWRIHDFTGYIITFVAKLNAKLVVGTTVGMYTFDYLSEEETWYDTSSTPAIVNDACNDVTMTVLPDAPIDSETGIQVPTIAVTTDGGVSVIDGPAGVGTVVDITFNVRPFTHYVNFRVDKSLVFTSDSTSLNGRFLRVYHTIPSTDILDTDGRSRGSEDEYYTSDISFPSDLYMGTDFAIVQGITDGALGLPDRLTLLKENPITPADGMVAYITSNYFSGWMQGDIKMATLADTVAETVGTDITTELVSNGDFDDEVGWNLNDAAITIGSGTLNVSGAQAGFESATQDSVVETGKKYRCRYEVTSYTAGTAHIRLGTAEGDSNSSIGFYDEVITASSTYIGIYFSSDFIGSIDNVSVREVTEHVTNGTFDTDTDWTHNDTGTGTSVISGGSVSIVRNSSGDQGRLTQAITTIPGVMYQLSVDFVSGTVHRVFVGTVSGGQSIDVAIVSADSFSFKAETLISYITLNADATGTCEFDNISVTEAKNLVNNGEFSRDAEWTKGTGWTIGSGVASSDGTQTGTSNLNQTTEKTLAIGESVRITFEMVSISAGGVHAQMGATDGTERTAIGWYTEVITSSVSSAILYMQASVDFIGSIDNVLLEEVTLVDGQWVTADELVSNGGFEGLTTGWTAGNGGLVAGNAGRLSLTNDSTGANQGVSYQNITTVQGTTYSLEIDGTIYTSTPQLLLRDGTYAAQGTVFYNANVEASTVITFIALSSSTVLILRSNTIAASVTCYYDNITVKAIQNLVENGEFSSDRVWDSATGWSIGSGVATFVSGGGNSSFAQTASGSLGKTVHIQYEIMTTSSVGSGVAPQAGIGSIGTYNLTVGVYSETLTVTTDEKVGIRASSTWDGTVDNVIVTELDVPDVSVNNNPLQVVGELVKTAGATGADLVAWSGFSAADYIEQPYNSDLDFGTGDFYVMGWWDFSIRSGSQRFVDRRALDGITNWVTVAVNSAEVPFLYTKGASSSAVTSVTGTALTPGVHFLCGLRDPVGLKMYVDGKLYSSVPDTPEDISNVLATLRVGTNNTTTSGEYIGGGITLFRMGAGAPSADQILEIYNTEKALFPEDSKCTLNGSSDAVVAVKYDKRTDVLKVATGTDLTYFSGVKVIDGPTPSESTGTIVAIDILEEYNIVATDANAVLNKTILDLPIEHDVTPLFNVINVAKAGGDFTNLKDALDSITDNDSSHRYTIRVAPGIYEEDNPLQGKEYTTIKAMGDLQTTRITALNASQDLIIMSAYFTVEGLAFWGVTGTTNYAVNQSVAGLTSLTRCLFGDCSNGVLLAHASASMTIGDCGVFNPAETTLKGIYCTAGALNINTFIGSYGTITTLLEVTGVNSIVTANHIRSTLSTLATGISIKDLAQVDVNSAKLLNMATGIEVEDDIHVHIDGARIGDATVDGIRVNDVGTDASLTMHSTIVKRSANFDINVLSATALVEVAISSTLTNINIVQGASVYGTILDLEEDDEGLNVLGELHVGTPENPAESVFGEGDSYTRGLLAYTWDGSVYVDISVNVRSPSASSFTFPNTTVGTAIYVASDLTVGASPDYHQFFGLKMALSTAQIGGTIVGEYYNGSAWVEFSHMTSESGGTYYRKADELFLVDAGGYQIRFDPGMASDWAKSDNPSVDVNDRYWIRFRITSSPSTLPIFEQFKLHSNRHEINNDGFGEDMGKARAYRTLPISWNTFHDVGTAVGNQDLWLSTNCKAGFENNAMSQGDSVGSVTSLPSWVDTSGHLRLQISGIPVTTGNYTLTAYINSSNTGDTVSTSDPTSTTGETSVSLLVACTAGQQAWWTFNLDIHDKGVEALLSDPESIWINIEATTTAGVLYGLQFDLQFLSWRRGSHI